jgi:GAF domain-containing protein
MEESDGQDIRNMQESIRQQAEEIERLRRQVADGRFAEELREALALVATAGTIAAPVADARLLEMIVQVAAQVISARSGSLFLVDKEAQELVFAVALGPKAAEIKKFRVPLGHGIAGLVAVTGQPMAISNAQEDTRHASDIAEAVGYRPQNLLTVPLFYKDEVIGVLQLLDKVGTLSFTPFDMEVLGLFANQAAVAIEQSRIYQNLTALMHEELASLSGVPEHRKLDLQDKGAGFVANLEEDKAHMRTLDLARLVQEISAKGENEAEACLAILRGFADYLRSRAQSAGETGAML